MKQFKNKNRNIPDGDTDLRQKTNSILNLLNNKLSCLRADDDSLLSGNLGLTIYHFYLSKTLNEDDLALNSITIIDEIFERIGEQKSSLKTFQYSNGLAGLGSVLQFLVTEGIIEFDLEEDFKVFDEVIYENALKQINGGNVEFLHGGCGALYYFSLRSPSPSLSIYIQKLVLAILKQIKKDPLCYRIPRSKFPWAQNDNYDYGLSHGLCGVVNILLGILENDDIGVNNLIESYLNNVAAHIIRLKRDVDFDKGIFSSFPSYLDKDLSQQTIDKIEYWNNSRLAWCYGDLGWVLFLYRFGIHSKDNAYLKLADEVGLNTTLRKTVGETGSDTSHFCHGHSGLAHMYKKIYDISENPIYKKAYYFWINKTLNELNYEIPKNYYKEIKVEASFLEGPVGISLVLNSFLNEDEIRWGKFFLL